MKRSSDGIQSKDKVKCIMGINYNDKNKNRNKVR